MRGTVIARVLFTTLLPAKRALFTVLQLSRELAWPRVADFPPAPLYTSTQSTSGPTVRYAFRDIECTPTTPLDEDAPQQIGFARTSEDL